MPLKSITNQSKVRVLVMLINLDSRPDRLFDSRIEAEKSNFTFLRIPAVDTSDVDGNQEDFLSTPARACLESHLKCYTELINSDFDFALILEDDFEVKSKRKFIRTISTTAWGDFDLVQLGFLYMDIWHRIDILLKLLKNFVFERFRSFSNIDQDFGVKIREKLEVKKRVKVPPGFMIDDLRSGSHAYLVSKDMARRLLELSNSVYLPIDGFLATLQYTNKFKLIRSKRSLVRQRKSQSDIK